MSFEGLYLFTRYFTKKSDLFDKRSNKNCEMQLISDKRKRKQKRFLAKPTIAGNTEIIWFLDLLDKETKNFRLKNTLQ